MELTLLSTPCPLLHQTNALVWEAAGNVQHLREEETEVDVGYEITSCFGSEYSLEGALGEGVDVYITDNRLPTQ